MKSLTEQLANYASYHRDRRNIATHLIGIPMILFAVIILLSRPQWALTSPVSVTPALIASVLTGLYYLKLDIPLGVLMSVILAALLKFAEPLAAATTMTWLIWGLGLFIVGWIFQSIGHIWEGRKPAFFDDVIGLVIGPLFVAAEVVFALGGRAELLRDIEARAGKTRHSKNEK